MEKTIKDMLEQLLQNSIKKKKYQTLQINAEKHLKKERCLLHFLNISLNNKKQSIEQLEKFSLTSLYHSIIGNKREKINIVQQEYLTTKLKYDSCKSTINDLIKDIKSYQKDLDDYEQTENNLINILKNKSQLTKEQSKQVKSIEKCTQLKATKIKLQQAIKVGVQLKKQLNSAYTTMRSAGNWGFGDMLGGGLFTTAIKHRKINSSKKQLEKINNLMIKFKQKLHDFNKFDNQPLIHSQITSLMVYSSTGWCNIKSNNLLKP